MTGNRSLNYKVGLFVLASTGLFLMLVVLALGPSFGKDHARYTIHFYETVKGMVRGSPVNFQGVNIGSVTDMRFANGITEVSIEIEPDKAPIQTDTRASLDRAWVTGQVTVELDGWSEDGTLLLEGGVIQAKLSPGAVVMRSMPQVVERITQILEEFEGVGKGVNRLLSGDSELLGDAQAALREVRDAGRRINALLAQPNVDRISRLLATTEKSLAHVHDATLPRLDEAVARVSGLAANLESATSGGEVKSLLTEGGRLAAGLRGYVPALRRVSEELAVFLRGNRRSIGKTLTELAATMRELQGIARMLRSAPSALVWGSTVPQRKMRDIHVPAVPPASPAGGKR